MQRPEGTGHGEKTTHQKAVASRRTRIATARAEAHSSIWTATVMAAALVSKTVQQAITNMVQLSSTVIEEQIRAGQAAAARMRDGIANSRQLNTDVNLVIDNLVATTKDVGATWLDLLSIMARSIGKQSPGPGGPGGPARTGTTQPRTITRDRHLGRRRDDQQYHRRRSGDFGRAARDRRDRQRREEGRARSAAARAALRAGRARASGERSKTRPLGREIQAQRAEETGPDGQCSARPGRRHLHRRHRRQQHQPCRRHGKCHHRS